MIVVDFRFRFTVIDMNDMPVPMGQIHSFHSYRWLVTALFSKNRFFTWRDSKHSNSACDKAL